MTGAAAVADAQLDPIWEEGGSIWTEVLSAMRRRRRTDETTTRKLDGNDKNERRVAVSGVTA